MADVFTRKKRSQIMSRIRSKDTRFELEFRRILWKAGYRYRKHYGPFKIDIAFPRMRVAVFLDSCFWHYCPQHGSIPRTRTTFWRQKLQRNRNRDMYVTGLLEEQGWIVIRLWEHDLKNDLEGALRKLRKTLQK